MITYSNLSKSFNNQTVLENINVTVPSAQITTLVGKNGSGKTTLMRLTASLLKPDTGYVKNDGKIGILLGGNINLYGNLTVKENIKYFADLQKTSEKEFRINYDAANEFIAVKEFEKMKFSDISRGMQQKTALVISIIHNPDIILLDEPSTGLDLIAAKEVFLFVRKLKKAGKTVFISSHNISEIADLSDNIAILTNKKIGLFTKTKDFFSDCRNGDQIKKICDYLECHDE